MKIITIFLFLFMAVSDIGEARSRRGRSFGRSSGKSLFNSSRRANTNRSRNNRMGQPRRSGTFMKSMMGAVAGTMIGGFLFKALGMNPGGMGAGGGGGGGFLILLLLIGGGVFIYFRYKKSTAFAGPNYQYNENGLDEQDTRPFESGSSNYGRENNSVSDQDPHFISDRNKDFFSIQHAWSKKNLETVKDKMTPEVYNEFMSEINEMNTKGHTSTLENLMINKTEIVSSWDEDSKKYMTLRFSVSLIEYEADKEGKIVSGKKDGYTDINELWTFEKEGMVSDWKVSGVEDTGDMA